MKSYDELTLTDDFLFSKIMQDEEICKELVELLLDVEVGKIQYLSNQQTIDEDLFGHGVRFDVYLKDSDKVFDIEMQATNKHDLPKRARYYQAVMDVDELKKGKKYTELKESFILFICTFDPFSKGEYKYSFSEKCEEITDLFLNDKTHKVFYNASAYSKSDNKKLHAFLHFLTTEKAESDFTQKLARAVHKAKGNDPWRSNYMTLAMKYEEWLEEGLEKGLAQGLKEGVAKGLVKGREEGIQQNRIETAKKLFSMNVLSVEQISQVTGLTIEQINSIK